MQSHYPRILITLITLLAIFVAVFFVATVSADSHDNPQESEEQESEGDDSSGQGEPRCPSCITRPPKPTGLDDSSTGQNSIEVEWNSRRGFAKYQVQYKESSNSSWITASSSITTASYTKSSLQCNTSYDFRVRAFGDGDDYTEQWGAWSSTHTASTTTCDNISEPEGLEVTSSTSTSITLGWDSLTGAHRYRVERSLTGTGGWVARSSTISSTSYTDNSITCGTTYHYRVSARGDGHPFSTTFGDPSSSVSKTPKCPTISTPGGLEVTGSTSTSITLGWDSLTDAHRYRVERSLTGTGGWVTRSSTISDTSYTDNSITCGTTYHYRVSARGDGHPFSTTFGNPSSSVSKTPGCPTISTPSGLEVTGSTNTSISLEWDSLTGAHRYRVERSLTGTGGWVARSSTISGTSYTDNSITCGTTYYYRVSARGDGHPFSTTFGNPSSSVSKTSTCPTISTPGGLEVTGSTSTSITLGWDSLTNAHRYRIERSATGTGGWSDLSSTISRNSYTDADSSLTCNTTYHYRVSARGDGHPFSTTFSRPSSSVSGKAALCLPEKPTGVTVTTTLITALVSWDELSGATKYEVDYDVVDPQAQSGPGGPPSDVNTFKNIRGLSPVTSYDFKVRAHGDGVTYASEWGPWSDTIRKATEGAAPTGLSLSIETDDADDVDLAYTSSEDSTQNLQFQLHRSDTEMGTYTLAYTNNDSSASPADFDDVDAGWYKGRGRNCETSTRTDCGPWSALSDAIRVVDPLDPPTGLSLSIETGDSDDLDLTFTLSGESTHHYQFELHRSDTRTGTYTLAYTNNDSSASPADFDDVDRGHWYRARGRNCETSTRTDCGTWSSWSGAIRILLLPPKPTGVTVTPTLITALVRWEAQSGGGISQYGVSHSEVGAQNASGFSGPPPGVNTFKTISGLSPVTSYDFKVRAHGDGVTYASEWGPWSDTVRKTTEGAAPTGLSLSIETGDADNLDLAYTPSGDSTQNLQFELRRSDTETGTYTLAYTNNDSTSSPADFDDVDAGWYKGRGRNCETSTRTDCGPWSPLSDAIRVVDPLDPPTGLSLSIETGDSDNLNLAYTLSGESTHHYQFELHRSDTRTGTYTLAYTNNGSSASPADFDDVDRGHWYRARGRNCETSTRTGCGTWSSWSTAVNILSLPPKPTGVTVTTTLITALISWDEISGVTEYDVGYDVVDPQAQSGPGGPPSDVNTFKNIRGLSPVTSYDFKVRAHGDGVTYASEWGPWSDVVRKTTEGAAPTGLSLSIETGDADDLDLAYTPSGDSTQNLQFELHRSDTEMGTYTLAYTNNDSTSSPADFDDVDKDKWYKGRGRNCETSTRTDCGPWSALSDAIRVGDPLDPPTGLSLSIETGDSDDLDLTYTLSGESTHHYQFELHRSDTRTGTYTLAYTNNGSAASPADFDDVDRGHWYRARGRNCETSTRTDCGTWSSWSTAVNILSLPPKPTGVTVTPTLITALVRWEEQTGGGISQYGVSHSEVGVQNASESSGPPSGVNTFKTISGLSPVTSYDFKVRAHGDGVTYASEWGPWSDTVRKTTEGAAPTGLSLSIETGDADNLDLAYTPSGDSTQNLQFELHRSDTQTGMYTLAYTNNVSTSSPADFDDVDKDKWYKARGRNCETSTRTDCGPWSPFTEAIQGSNPPGQVAQPTVTPADGSLSVSWSAPSSNRGSAITGYNIRHKVATATMWTSSGPVTGTSSTISSLTNGTSYEVQVQACNPGGCGDWSVSAVGTPTDELLVTITAKPANPSPGQAVTITPSVINAPSGINPSYQWEGQFGGSGGWINLSTASRLSYLTALSETISFRVTLTYGLSGSATSDPLAVTWAIRPASAPMGLNVTASTADSVTLSWTAVPHAEAYWLERQEGATGSWIEAVSETTGTTLTASNLKCNTPYNFRVSARGDGDPLSTNFGDPSSTVSKSTGLCLPPRPTGVTVTTTLITALVNWDAPPKDGVSMYEVDHDVLGPQGRSGSSGPPSGVNTFQTVSGLSAVTSYDFRVRAHGDGVIYASEWSEWSDTVRETTKGKAPTSLTLSIEAGDDDDLDLSYTLSTDPTHFYVFELHRSDAEDGSFALYRSRNDSASSPAHFSDVDKGYWYRARGRNCEDSSRTDCGPWSALSNVIRPIDQIPESACSNGTVVPNPTANTGLVADCKYILGMTNILKENGPVSLNWRADTDITTAWEGLTFGGTPKRITGLDLNGKGFKGTMPQDLHELAKLTTLDLSNNQLTGSLPNSLNRLSSLTTLDLSDNRLSGSIPQQWGVLGGTLGDFSNLTTLDLRNNQLTGKIPATLANLSNLTHLYLNGNTFGCLSSSLQTFISSVSNNDLNATGLRVCAPLPAAASCSNGTVIPNPTTDANRGLVTDCETILGTIVGLKGTASVELDWSASAALTDWEGLTITSFTDAGTGEMFSRVTGLSLRGRGLGGTIPSGLNKLVKLDTLDLAGNQLTGSIPSQLGDLTNLQTLKLFSNQLSGTIPSALGGLTALVTLDLSNNGLTGSIPTELGGLSSLTTLYLLGNGFTGCIPAPLESSQLNDVLQLGLRICEFTVSLKIVKDHGTILATDDWIPFEDTEWGVMANVDVRITEAPSGVDLGNYTFRIKSPAGTGFQVYAKDAPGNRACQWPTPAHPWTDEYSPWTSGIDSLSLVRCDLGDGATHLQVQVKHTATNEVFQTRGYSLQVEQAWHRADHQVSYKLDDTLLGNRPSGAFPDYTPMSRSEVSTAVSNAADIWSGRHSTHMIWGTGTAPVPFDSVTSSPDVIIKGYWNPYPKTDKCNESMACTLPKGDYSHIGQGQELWLEFPPQRRSDADHRTWTNDITLAVGMDGGKYYYLPRVMMHELAHTAGLGHAPSSSDSIMGPYKPLEKPLEYDLRAMESIYDGHMSHTP